MRQTLTVKLLDALKPRDRRYEIWDQLTPSFGVRVSSEGRKTFFVVYRMGDDRQRRLTLGQYPILTLAEAREKALEAKRQVANGVDPAKPKRVRSTLLRDVVVEFIEKHAKPKNKDWRKAKSRLDSHLVRELGDREITSITKRDIIDLIDDIVARGAPVQANRVLAAVRKFFNWCAERDIINASPCASVRPPSRETSRDRVLTDDELKGVWQGADRMGFPFGSAVQMLILTGQRRGEVFGMRWSELDLAAKVWRIPGERAKNDNAHTVPLSDAAMAIIRPLPRFLNSDLVFTHTGRAAVSNIGQCKEKLDAASGVSGWRLHDLRRTAASGMARLGTAPHIIERVLNHLTGSISGVAAVYNRYGYDDEKRAALALWGARVVEAARGEEQSRWSLAQAG